MNSRDLKPVQMYCINCGHKLTGYKSEDGAVRIICPKCEAVIYSKMRGGRETNIRVTAPRK